MLWCLNNIVKILLKNEANINARGNRLMTPLHLACKNNHVKIINMFAQFDNIKINAKDDDGLTPLYYIGFYNQNLEAAEILINFGAELEFTDKDTKRSLLHLAAMRGEANVVQFLSPFVNVNVQDIGGNTPLHLAVAYGHLDVAGKKK